MFVCFCLGNLTWFLRSSLVLPPEGHTCIIDICVPALVHSARALARPLEDKSRSPTTLTRMCCAVLVSLPPGVRSFRPIFARARNEPKPRQRNDGSGRDSYLAEGGKAPHTSFIYSSRTPSQRGPAMMPRSSGPPPFTPSGSGRDMFSQRDQRQIPFTVSQCE